MASSLLYSLRSEQASLVQKKALELLAKNRQVDDLWSGLTLEFQTGLPGNPALESKSWWHKLRWTKPYK